MPADFARYTARSAGFRNRLVHEYDEIDPEKVYEAAKMVVEDVPKYLRYVNDYIESL